MRLLCNVATDCQGRMIHSLSVQMSALTDRDHTKATVREFAPDALVEQSNRDLEFNGGLQFGNSSLELSCATPTANPILGLTCPERQLSELQSTRGSLSPVLYFPIRAYYFTTPNIRALTALERLQTRQVQSWLDPR